MGHGSDDHCRPASTNARTIRTVRTAGLVPIWCIGVSICCSNIVAFRIGPECISICLNDIARPHWCGNYTIAPEKCGIGPESSNSTWRSAWVRGLLSLVSV